MKFTLENESIRVVVSDLGATLDSLFDKASGMEHAWPYDPAVWPRRTHLCFPVCGKLLDGEYSHGGRTYPMPMHGFLREKTFQVEARTADSATLAFASDRETRELYPFDFSVRVRTTLIGKGVEIAYCVENHGDSEMPYSIGSHYNYMVPANQDETLCDFEIDFGSLQSAGRIEFSDGFVAGSSEDIFKGAKSLRLGNLFSKGAIALALADLTTREVTLRGTKSGFFTHLGMENFDHLLLWAPSDAASFVCMEVWAGLPDRLGHDKVLKNKTAVRLLPSGQVHEYFQRIQIG
ncbi:MAG: aldose 1-epimerase [Spirochaetes bacterium]|nr:MAG: aldose 1-epimerase [Spirochaetota bacterium]